MFMHEITAASPASTHPVTDTNKEIQPVTWHSPKELLKILMAASITLQAAG